MNTKHIFLVALLITSLSTIAQEKQASYIGLTVGPSAATGNFRKADAGDFGHWNNQAGFGKTGIALGVEGAYYLTSKFGLAGTIAYSTHGGFSGKDVATLSASYTDAFGVDYSTVATHGSYSTMNILAGPQLSFRMGRFIIDIRALGGVVRSLSTPEMTVLLEDQIATTFKQKSSTASAFGWQTGAGIRYPFTHKLSFVLRGDYFACPGITISNENRTNDAGRLVTKQPLSWVSGTAGLALLLHQ